MKIAKLLFYLSLLFFTHIAKAADPFVLKGGFSGKISDAKTGAPISGASIYFQDIKTGTTTNSEGLFIFQHLPEGKHLIEISHIGYKTISEYIDIVAETKKDYVLTESVVENSAVIVTGTNGATQLKKVPFQVTVLRKEELLQSSSTNIIESLSKKPGISTISSGPAISKPVIRGLSSNRVLTINDGVRQEGQQWGDEHGIEIDEASVNKVEILKGPASLIYGSDAMAGVINIITNVPVSNNTIKANVLSGYQTNNNQKLFHANIAGNTSGFNWNLYGSSVTAADYKNENDGKVFNSKFNQHNFGGYAGYNAGWGYSHVLFSKFNLKTGLIEGERDGYGNFLKPVAGGLSLPVTSADFSTVTPQIPYQHVQHLKVALDNSFKLGKNRLSLNVGYQQNQREEFGNPDNLSERALFFDLKTITYATQFHLAEIHHWKTSVGINGMKQDNKNKGAEQLIPDYSLLDIGGYLFTQKTFKEYTFSGGFRYDTRNVEINDLMDGAAVKSNGFSRSFSNFSGSIGMAAQLTSNLNFKINLARGYRAPSIPELASNGSHEGTNRYEYGDKNLKNETSMQFDAGIDFTTEHISFSISAFNNSFRNFIFYRKLTATAGGDSVIDVNGDLLTTFKFEQRAATLSGAEASIDFHPHPLDWLHIQNTFSIVAGRLKDKIETTNFLPFIPAPRLITEVKGDFKKAGDNVRNLYVKAELDNTFDQDNVFTAYNTETRTSGYSLFNIGAGADIVTSKGITLFSLHFSGNNITDIAYQNHLSRLKYAPQNMLTGRNGVFNMGRNFSIKLNVPLSFTIKKSK